MVRLILKFFVVLFVLGFVANMVPVVLQAATHCEVKLVWGKYVDVTRSDWAKDWVKGCKEAVNMPKSEFSGSGGLDHMKFQPMTPGKF